MLDQELMEQAPAASGSRSCVLQQLTFGGRRRQITRNTQRVFEVGAVVLPALVCVAWINIPIADSTSENSVAVWWFALWYAPYSFLGAYLLYYGGCTLLNPHSVWGTLGLVGSWAAWSAVTWAITPLSTSPAAGLLLVSALSTFRNVVAPTIVLCFLVPRAYAQASDGSGRLKSTETGMLMLEALGKGSGPKSARKGLLRFVFFIYVLSYCIGIPLFAISRNFQQIEGVLSIGFAPLYSVLRFLLGLLSNRVLSTLYEHGAVELCVFIALYVECLLSIFWRALFIDQHLELWRIVGALSLGCVTDSCLRLFVISRRGHGLKEVIWNAVPFLSPDSYETHTFFRYTSFYCQRVADIVGSLSLLAVLVAMRHSPSRSLFPTVCEHHSCATLSLLFVFVVILDVFSGVVVDTFVDRLLGVSHQHVIAWVTQERSWLLFLWGGTVFSVASGLYGLVSVDLHA